MFVLLIVECSLSAGSTCYIDEIPVAASMPTVDVRILFH